MTSERSKRRDFLSLIFISKTISKKLLIRKLNLLLNMTSSGLIVVGAFAGGLTANPAILGSISGAGLVRFS